MLVRAVKLQLAEGQTLVGALEAFLTAKWSTTVQNGQTIVSTAEAGGSVTFTFERTFTPSELAGMADQALAWLNCLPDPENPPLDVPRYRRIHTTFHRFVP